MYHATQKSIKIVAYLYMRLSSQSGSSDRSFSYTYCVPSKRKILTTFSTWFGQSIANLNSQLADWLALIFILKFNTWSILYTDFGFLIFTAYFFCRLLIICRHIIAFFYRFFFSFCDLKKERRKKVSDKNISTFLSFSLLTHTHTHIESCCCCYSLLFVSFAAQQQQSIDVRFSLKYFIFPVFQQSVNCYCIASTS